MIAFRDGAKLASGLYDELVVDCFAGGGGASTGIEAALGRAVDVAINHDPEAVELHRVNHPNTRHYCEDIFAVDPLEATAGRPVGLAWFSPDCKHFSKAKGGRPVSKRVRGLAWVVVRWARAVRPRVIMLENVEEFTTWGPLGADNRPCPRRKGRTFRRWVRSLEQIGYRVEWRELRACEYGAPTIRKRLFLIARCDGEPIVWPERTHGNRTEAERDGIREGNGRNAETPRREKGRPERGTRSLRVATRLDAVADGARDDGAWRDAGGQEAYKHRCRSRRSGQPGDDGLGQHPAQERGGGSSVLPWRTAAECIDWSIPCPSIFERKRPLKPATLRRVAAGIRRFVLEAAEPFIVRYRGSTNSSAVDINTPAPTITAGSFIKRPAGAGHGLALCAPTLIETGYGERTGQRPRVPGLHRPLGTAVAGGQKHALVAAFLAQHNGGFNETPGHRPSKPLSTITAGGCQQQLVAAHLTHFYTSNTRGGNGDPRRPAKTITAEGTHAGLVAAFLTAYYANERDGQDPREPLRTVTTKDRLAAVTIEHDGRTYAIADIGMRMLTPRELYRCQGFPDSYVIDRDHEGWPLTKTAQVRMVGNSVCPPMAEALVRANITSSIARAAALAKDHSAWSTSLAGGSHHEHRHANRGSKPGVRALPCVRQGEAGAALGVPQLLHEIAAATAGLALQPHWPWLRAGARDCNVVTRSRRPPVSAGGHMCMIATAAAPMSAGDTALLVVGLIFVVVIVAAHQWAKKRSTDG